MILSNDPGSADQFSVIVTRFTSKTGLEHLTTGMMSPFRERFDGVNTYRLYIGKFPVFVKVDQRPFEEPLRSFVPQHNRPLYVLDRVLEDTKDFRAMLRVAEESVPKKSRLRGGQR